ncbi:MAG: hypothetical protein ACP5VQ_11725, partial [Phycisphaerae bacterium]
MRPLKQPPRKLQQVEIPEFPVAVVEHRRHGYFCPHCQKVHYAPLPPEIQNRGLVGPRLTAWIAYLKGSCHCSFSTIRKFCRDVLQLPAWMLRNTNRPRTWPDVSAKTETPIFDLPRHQALSQPIIRSLAIKNDKTLAEQGFGSFCHFPLL